MFVFDDISTRRTLSPWGIEVKKRLLEVNMRQDDIVAHLKSKGFDIEKSHLSNLFFGIGARNRKNEIAEINRFLGISQ
jgi:uncharacterized protein YehS (DUF1456 family)